MSATTKLEENLNDVFVKRAPPLPQGGKKAIVEWAPWLSLIGGILTLWAAYALWHWAHVANDLINYANSLSAAFGGTTVVASRMTLGIWLGVGVLGLEAVLYLLAFPGLRDRKKSGWEMIFYAMLVNLVYGVVVVFTDYGGIGTLLGTLIGTAVGMYLLFQVRSSYTGAKEPAEVMPVVTPKV